MSRYRWTRRLAFLATAALGGSAAALWAFPRIAYYRRVMVGKACSQPCTDSDSRFTKLIAHLEMNVFVQVTLSFI